MNKLFNDYEAFIEKFKPKRTTDDCYTPPEVYQTVRDYVDAHVFPLAGHRIVRPFYPGGDYESYDYEAADVVLDNPPFSILSRIVTFYVQRGIRFFIFAPTLQLCPKSEFKVRGKITAVVCGANIIYANGAVVNTSFITNIWPNSPAMVVCGSLCKAIEQAQKAIRKDKSVRRVKYPPNVVSGALLSKLAKRGIDWTLPSEETFYISKLNCGQSVYGGGFLISERLAAERSAAERLAAERLAAERSAARECFTYQLDASKELIIKDISKKVPRKVGDMQTNK